jgi:hypothetical protein
MSKDSKQTEPDYCGRILIKLKRQYGKDEVVAALMKEVKEKDVEIGQLKAEVDHLSYEKSKLYQKEVEQFKLNNAISLGKELAGKASGVPPEIIREARISVRKEELYKNLRTENASLKERIKKLRNELGEVIARNRQLMLEK